MSTHRARWAAIGAALAVTIGGGGVGLVRATSSSGERAVYVSITSCRLFDTRPAPDNVGPRTAPLSTADSYTVTARGDNGNCTGIPADAVSVVMNVTATDATALTFLAFWPDGPRPGSASSLNPAPGAPPTPNAVTTRLSATGTFNVYNHIGSVNVLADIVGYYVDHNHDDRYYQKSEIDAIHPQAAATPVGVRCNASDTGTSEPRDGQFDGCSGEITLGSPTSHTVLLVANIGWGGFQVGAVKGSCRLERNGIEVPFSTITMGETTKTTEESNAGGIDNRRLNWAGVTAISGPNTGNAVYRVACREVVGDIQFNEITLSGIVTSP